MEYRYTIERGMFRTFWSSLVYAISKDKHLWVWFCNFDWDLCLIMNNDSCQRSLHRDWASEWFWKRSYLARPEQINEQTWRSIEIETLYLCIGGITHEKIEKAFHHPRGIGLTRMNTSSNDYAFLHLMLSRARWMASSRSADRWTGYREHVDEIAG